MADRIAIIAPMSATNTPAIVTAAGTALEANSQRGAWQIQNLGINPLFVLLGTGASTSVFHTVLKGGSGSDDGLGASMSQENGCVYTGVITVAGTSPRFTVLELTQ